MFSVLMKSQKQEQYAKVFLLKLKNYITMWVPLSSRPSPRHFTGWDWGSDWKSWCESI